jgi:threonine/homoserine/homoserine lactone efflux protein
MFCVINCLSHNWCDLAPQLRVFSDGHVVISHAVLLYFCFYLICTAYFALYCVYFLLARRATVLLNLSKQECVNMELFSALVFFAFATSITPGPNNIMIMSSGVNYGVQKSLAHLAGIQTGFLLMLLAVGLGAGVVLQQQPVLHQWIKFIGSVYLLYLAWKIATAEPVQLATGSSKPLSFIQALLFQWVNAKAWVMITGAIAAFTSLHGVYWQQLVLIAAVFLLVGLPCTGSWLLFGAGLKRLLTAPRQRRWFNYVMGTLLALSVLPPLWQAVQAFSS